MKPLILILADTPRQVASVWAAIRKAGYRCATATWDGRDDAMQTRHPDAVVAHIRTRRSLTSLRRWAETIDIPVICQGPKTVLTPKKRGNLPCLPTPVRPGQMAILLDIMLSASRQAGERIGQATRELSKLSNAIDHSDDAVVITDLHGVIEYVNPAFERYTGFTRRDVLGKTPRVVKSGLHDRSFYESMWKTILSGQVFRDIHFNRRKNGVVFPVEQTISPVRDSRGQLTHFIGIWKDLTDKRKVESDLASAQRKAESSQKLYEGILNCTREGIIAVDEDQKVVLFNHGAEILFGYDRADVLGQPLSLLLPEAMKARHEDLTKGFFRSSETGREAGKRRPLPCRRKDGSEFIAEISLSAYRDEETSLFTAVVRDVSEIHRLMEKYRIVADNTNDWEFWRSPDRQYVYVSPSCRVITGYSAEEFMSDPGLVGRIVHPDDAAMFAEHQTRVCEQPRVASIEFRIIRRDGEERWIGHVCQPIYGEDGRFLGVRGSNRDITERKKAEQQLLLSQSSYEGIINSITEAVYLQDESGVFIDVNHAAEKMYGYRRDEFIGRTPEFLSAPGLNDHVPVAHYVEKALHGNPQQFEFWGRRKDGTIFPKDVSLTPGSYFGRKVVIAVARDITDRKRAEERFRSMIENAPDGVVLVSKEGKFRYISPSTERIFGYRVDDLIDTDAGLRVHPDDQSFVLATLDKLVQMPALTPTIQYRFRHADGAWRWLESTFSNMLSESSLQAIVINFRDITERKQAEELVRASEEKYRILAETSRDLVVLYDFDGHILYANPSMERLLGYSPDDLRQRTVSDLVAPEFMPATLERRSLREAGSLAMQQYEIDLLTRDGQRVPFEVSTTVAASGERPLVVSVARDIRERRKAEKTLKDQLRFARALSRMLEAVITPDASREEMLTGMVQVIGEALEVDRCLIFDINVTAGQVRSLSKWMGPDIVDFTPGTETYDLALFAKSATRLVEDGQPIASHDTERHPVLLAEGSASLLHDRMKVKSLLWYPFDRRADGSFLLVFNQMSRQRAWTPEELDFVDSVSKQVTIALMKMRLVAERHEAELFQRAAEQRYREIFDNVVEGVFQTSLHGDFIVANSAMARILGYDSPEDLMHQVTNIESQLYVDPNRRRELQRLLDERDHVADFESQVVRGDGRRIWISENIRAVRNPSGKTAYYEGTVVDITDRKTVEIKLVETLKEFETLTEGIPDAIFFKDGAGRWLITNAAAKKLFRLESIEWYGCTDPELSALQPDLAPAYEVCISSDNEAWRKGQRWDGLEIIPDAAGRPHYFQTTKIPLFKPDGNRMGLVIIGHDVTLERQSQETIKEQEILLDNAKDAIVVTDLDYRVLFLNQSAEKLYEWKREDAVGQNLMSLISGPSHPISDTLPDILRSGGWAGELVHRSRSGRELLVESRQSLIKDSSGQPKSVLFINTDITEKKKMEQQFLRAQRMESIGRMSSGIAHDLNNILSPILMAVQIFKEKVPDAALQKLIPLLESNVQRGADLMRKLLMFSRGAEGKYVHVDMKKVLSEIENITRSTFPKNISIMFVVPESLWDIRGDVTHLHQILLNLCVNARDAMSSGGQLTVEADNAILGSDGPLPDLDARPGRYVVLRVTDTGTGIPPELLDQIFEPFFSTKGLEAGTGLGLSTVAALVKAHQGSVSVDSAVGRGTTFRIYLPAAEETYGASQHTDGMTLTRGHGEWILVVDDEAPIRHTLCSILESHNYRVFEAKDGQEALECFQTHADISVVITDMSMPRLGGTELIRELRSRQPEIPIVAMSGLPDHGSDVMTIDGFLSKPYEAEKVLRLVGSILKK